MNTNTLALLIAVMLAFSGLAAAVAPISLSGVNPAFAKNLSEQNNLNWTPVFNMSLGRLTTERTITPTGPWAAEAHIFTWDNDLAGNDIPPK